MTASCFVAMPFGGDHDTDFSSVIDPAIRDAGLIPVRADEIFGPGQVLEQVWQAILESSVVVADTSERNPNVFYELGLAHAAQRPVLIITQQMDEIPFDLRSLRHIGYRPRGPEWAARLRVDITRTLTAILADPESAILSTFAEQSVAPQNEMTWADTRLLNIEEKLDQLLASIAPQPDDQIDLREDLASITSTQRLPSPPDIRAIKLPDGRRIVASKQGDEIRLRLGSLVVSVEVGGEYQSAASLLRLDDDSTIYLIDALDQLQRN